jgi:hypothetical protein
MSTYGSLPNAVGLPTLLQLFPFSDNSFSSGTSGIGLSSQRRLRGCCKRQDKMGDVPVTGAIDGEENHGQGNAARLLPSPKLA